MRDRPPDVDVGQDRVLHVEVEVGVAERGLLADRHTVDTLQVLDVLRREGRVDQIEIAGLERRRADRVVRDDEEGDTGEFRRATPVVGVRRQLDLAVPRPIDELEGAGPDRVVREILRGVLGDVLRHNRHVHVAEERRVRLTQFELDRLGIGRGHTRDRGVVGAVRRGEGFVEDRREGVDDVVGGEVGPVVELHPLPQVEDPGRRIGVLPTLRQGRLRCQRLIEHDQPIEDHFRHPERRGVVHQPGIARPGIDVESSPEHPGLLCPHLESGGQSGGEDEEETEEQALHELPPDGGNTVTVVPR